MFPKKVCPPNKIKYNYEIQTSDIDMANSFNDFFTNIGSAIEANNYIGTNLKFDEGIFPEKNKLAKVIPSHFKKAFFSKYT